MDSVGILGGCDRQPPLHLQGSSRLKTASWIRELDSGCWISKRSRQDQGQDKARSRQATATSRGLRLRHAHLNRRDEGRAAFWRPIRFKTRPADPSGSAESVALGTLSLRAIADVARRRLVPAGKTVTLDSGYRILDNSYKVKPRTRSKLKTSTYKAADRPQQRLLRRILYSVCPSRDLKLFNVCLFYYILSSLAVSSVILAE